MSEDSPKKASVGILFVHGIGEQPQGQTLWLFGEPLVRWLNAWLKRNQDRTVTDEPVKVTESIVNPAERQVSDPAYARVEVKLHKTDQAQEWLLAESWWGGELQQPTFRKVANWMLTAVTWMIVSHALPRGRSAKNRLGWVISFFLGGVLSLLIAGVTQLGVLVLIILALLPVEKVREALAGLLLWLTGVLGDSYVFVSNWIQQAAIITKVREDLHWLAPRCRSVVVIAHSQGAAVAHRALRSSDPDNVRLFVTVGSGLAKLEELESVDQKHRGSLRLTAVSIPLMIIAALTSVASHFRPLHIHLPGLLRLIDPSFMTLIVTYAFGLISLILFVTTLVLVQIYAQEMQKHIGDLSLRSWRREIKWFDLYASHDPVPNGPLAEDGQIDGLTSNVVTNGMSFVKDHNDYWVNSTDLVPKIFAKMDSELKLGLFQGPEETKVLESAAVHHRRRVMVKVAVFWATVLSAALFALKLWQPTLVNLGTRTIWPMLDKGVFTYLGDFLHGVGQLMSALISLIKPNTELHALGMGLLGATIPLGLIAVWYICFKGLWAWFDGAGTLEIFDPRAIVFRKAYTPIFATVVATGLLPLCLAILLILEPKLVESAGLVERLLFVLGAGLWACLGLVMLVILVYASLSLYRSPPAERKDNAVGLLVWGSLALTYFLYSISFEHSGTLQRLKELAPGLVFTLVIPVAVGFAPSHAKLVKTAASTGRRLLWWVALLLPLVFSLTATTMLLVRTKLEISNRSDVSDILSAILASYLCGLVFAWLAVKVAMRKERKAL